MKEKNNKVQLSYESDGKMGETVKNKNKNKNDHKDFFNTTQGSE